MVTTRSQTRINRIPIHTHHKQQNTFSNKPSKVVVGYKILENDWTCRDFQYNVGEEAIMNEEPELCKKGFHFCINPINCLAYYDVTPDSNHQFAKVIARGTIKHSKNNYKSVTNRLYVQKKISKKQFLRSCTGKSIDEDDTIRYYKNGQLHRDHDLPAVEWPCGSKEYYQDGLPHRDNGLPAREFADGTRDYFIHGQFIRSVCCITK